MEKVKVLVVEDNVIIAESIIDMIEKMGYECIGTAIRATKGLEIARKMKPDIALLDIQLKGEESGIWLAEQIKKELNIPFVFLTSFGDQKTIQEAVSTVPYGYILKPVQQQNIYAALETALSKFSAENSGSKNFNQKEKVSETDELPSFIIKDSLFVKDEYQFVKIILSDIDFIKSSGNYVELHSNGRKKVFKDTLKNFLSKLKENIFFQVHRSYIVNLGKIESIGGTSIKVNNIEVPIVKEKKDMLLELLNTIK